LSNIYFNTVHITDGPKRMDALSLLYFNAALEYIIKKVNKKWRVSLEQKPAAESKFWRALGENINIININTSPTRMQHKV